MKVLFFVPRAQARPSQQFNVIRRVYQQDALNKDADYQVPTKPRKLDIRYLHILVIFYSNCVPSKTTF